MDDGGDRFAPLHDAMPDGPSGAEDIEILFREERTGRKIQATPFDWRPEADIPRREWIYGKHLIRRFLSVDIAAGGVGKSSLKIGEAVAMAANQAIYGQEIFDGPLRVWIYNLEDPFEEIERRIHATAKRFDIKPAQLGNRLFVDSGRDRPVILAEENPRTGTVINRPVVDALIHELQDRQIDVLILDPFVSSHMVSENDNRAIDMVAKEYSRIANVCNCAINLVHHVRKQNGVEASADSARGASALIGAARSVLVYNRMSPTEAKVAGLPPEEMRFYFRTDIDKANLAPPEAATWFRMNNVDLDNGDKVGVACPWQMPDVFAGITSRQVRTIQEMIGGGEYWESVQSKDWAGEAVADVLGLDFKEDREKIKSLLRTWIKNKALKVVSSTDAKSRKSRPQIVVGEWVEL